MDDVMQYIF